MWRYARWIVLIVVIASGATLLTRWLQHRRQLTRQIADRTAQQVASQLSDAANKLDLNGPRLSFDVKLAQEVTTLTVTVTNPSRNVYKDLHLTGFALGTVKPRERDDLPFTIAQLPPGASRTLALHYDHLQWISDEVKPARIDLGWAQKPLDLSESWVVVPDPASRPNGPEPVITPAEFHSSNALHGVPVALAPATARALKAERDSTRGAASRP